MRIKICEACLAAALLTAVAAPSVGAQGDDEQEGGSSEYADVDSLFAVDSPDSTDDSPDDAWNDSDPQSDAPTDVQADGEADVYADVIPLRRKRPVMDMLESRGATQLDEIVVTANRRAETTQEIASGIAVMGGGDLEKSNAASFADYIGKLPGVDIVDAGVPKKLAIRGISNLATAFSQTNSSASPVGLYVNDTAIQGNGIMPDLGLYDLQRIEVLKGPQGTFYGEGAMGGMMRMVLNKASPDQFTFKGEIAAGQTSHGSGIDRAANVAVNIPIAGEWAARLVASDRVNQGYIDYTERGTKGEDDISSRAYRIHLDGRLFDALDVSAFWLYQHQHLDQFPWAQPEETGWLENRHTEPQFQDIKLSLPSLSLTYHAGFAEISSTSSYFANDSHLYVRSKLLSSLLASRTGGLLPPDLLERLGVLREEWYEATTEQVGWSQELRAVSTSDGWFNWVVGAYYRDRSSAVAGLSDSNVTTVLPPPVGPGIIGLDTDEIFEQLSLYGELGFALTDRLDLKLGYRWYEEDVRTVGAGYFRGPLFLLFPPDGVREGDIQGRTSNDTMMASLSWAFTDEAMIFVKYAEGTRSGGVNRNAIIADDIPELYKPDFLTSYEVGLKTQWWDGRITANLGLFDQNWIDMQVGKDIDAPIKGTGGLVKLPVPTVLNVAEAYSRGAEFDLSVNLLAGLTLAGSVFYGKGKVTKGDPDAYIPAGVPLPQLPELSYTASLSYAAHRLDVFGTTPLFQVDVQHTGSRSAYPPGDGVTVPEESTLDAFTVMNALIGLQGQSWSFSLGVKNLTDERYAVGMQSVEPETLTVARPRSFLFKVGYQM